MKLNLIQIQTVSYCNGKCIICPYRGSWYDKNPGEMSGEFYEKMLKRICDFAPGFNGKYCPYLCNEPFADRKIIPRIEKALDVFNKPFLEVSTNLTLASKPQLARLIELYDQNDWHGRIMVSHHGTTKEAYERIMGLKFGVAQDNLKYLLNNVGPKLPVWIHTACYSHDKSYVMASPLEIKRHWMDFLIDNEMNNCNVHIYPLQIHNRAGNVQLDDWKYDTTPRKPNGCSRVNDQLHIIYTGEVVLCCCDYRHETVLGDLTKQSIKDVFNSEIYQAYKAKVKGELESPPDFICKRCQWPGG